MDLAVVGVDGLDPGLIREWRAELPTLSRLISEGGFGEMQSSYPPLTCLAWSTLVTGKQGGKHGVFGFTKPDRRTRRGGRRSTTTTWLRSRSGKPWTPRACQSAPSVSPSW
ncbi:alkaline phosphatase family protein [Halorhabdus sp. CUG00001]|uniref:alkaline phosphatase family protein n=1 Tax=Halorhabdus sp. CUG00001 TaxID=2600297 RepID=UPI00131AFC09